MIDYKNVTAKRFRISWNIILQWSGALGAFVGMLLLSESMLFAGFAVTLFGCVSGLVFAWNNKIWAYVALDLFLGASAINGMLGV